MPYSDIFGTRRVLESQAGPAHYFDVNELERRHLGAVSRLPATIKIMLESVLRHASTGTGERDVEALAGWRPNASAIHVPLRVHRVLLQDSAGIPVVIEFAALREVIARFGGDPAAVNPRLPGDLVIDHSVQVDRFGSPEAIAYNIKREYERNGERYALVKWAQHAFDNLRIIPPGNGIMHQVNLEYLASVVASRRHDGQTFAFPDSLVGTDSHTPMINGIGVLGFGVGGIEAQAVMLDQPYNMVAPEVVGVRLSGELPEGTTGTDLVLTVTELLRRHGVVGKVVEFFGPGLSKLPVADRATIANMAPEYGATMGFFPVDEETLTYLRLTGRDSALVDLVERYTKAVGLFYRATDPEPAFSDRLELDMSAVEPSLAGPRRPQDRVPLAQVKASFEQHRLALEGGSGSDAQPPRRVRVERPEGDLELRDGAVLIAAITSCTNTSNPTVLVGAGLLARKAVERGLSVPPWVKTSLAPGSKVVTEYLRRADLLPALEALRFHVVGYGCTTCVGNSGPLAADVTDAVTANGIVGVAVLSGNRNFDGRIHPLAKANYLASPILVVAYALAGHIDVDLDREPLGHDAEGRPVYMKELWPTQREIRDTINQALDAEMFRRQYAHVSDGDENWRALKAPRGATYAWNPQSTYFQRPPFFDDFAMDLPELQDIRGARALVVLGDSVTTDHISPAGMIPADGPAGRYLIEQGIESREFNSYIARRGNHEVLVRATFANIRIRNRLVPDREGGYTIKFPEGTLMTVYDAATAYRAESTPLIVLAGKEYGTGSSRDWAAKGPRLLGVNAVIAESFERIHRANLIGMGILPLQFTDGESWTGLGLHGGETFDILGLEDGLAPGCSVQVVAHGKGGASTSFQARARLDTPIELHNYLHGGIMHAEARRLLREGRRIEKSA